MKTNSNRVLSFVGSFVLFCLSGCPGPQVKPTTETEQVTAQATAMLEAKSGSSATGEATFSQVESGLRISIRIKGATEGEHGLHIHEKGDCSAADASSAGGHLNPLGHDHGGLSQFPRHAGDLGNITVGKDGNGQLEILVKGLTVVPGEGSVAGKAVVLHEKPDDLRTQPSGNSGARISCGVIAAK
jgi:Cu-Zn family superoxide dismutase